MDTTTINIIFSTILILVSLPVAWIMFFAPLHYDNFLPPHQHPVAKKLRGLDK